MKIKKMSKEEEKILKFNKRPGGGMVDTLDSKSGIRKGVGVQVPPGPPSVKLFELKFSQKKAEPAKMASSCAVWSSPTK